jgi:hypothetical protein
LPKISAPKTEKPTEGYSIFRIDEQLEERQALLRCKAIEFPLLVVRPTGHVLCYKFVMNGVSYRAPLRKNQDILRSAALIVYLVTDERGNTSRLISQRIVLTNSNIASAISADSR